MTSQDVSVLSLHLFDHDDDAEDLEYKQVIDDLITQQKTPHQVAEIIDKWVVREANTKYDQLRQRNPPFNLTPEEKDRVYLVAPNASRHVEMIVGCIAKVCTAYPPGHAVQNSFIEFFQALKAMPRHEVPNLSYKDGPDEPTFDIKLTLWPFGTPSVNHLAQKFQREAEELAYPFSEVETSGSEAQLRWRNLQSFISRLTALELIDCSIASALPYILPSHYAYPDLEKRSIGGPQRIAGDLVAAAQWLEPDSVRQWVYDQCRSTGEVEEFTQIWSMDKWNQFKAQLSFIASDERFPQHTRDLAHSLGEKMESHG